MNKVDHSSADSRLAPVSFHFLVMVTCFSMVQFMLNTFLSTYTLAATGSAENVKVFNIILALGQPFAMIATIVMIRKYSAIRT